MYLFMRVFNCTEIHFFLFLTFLTEHKLINKYIKSDAAANRANFNQEENKPYGGNYSKDHLV